MGTLYYSETPIRIEDRALAHLKAVISTKLRRAESFTLSWVHPDDQDRGRSTIWLHSSIPLRFVFDDPESPELNPRWIQDLARSASSSGGIMLVAEQIEPAPGVQSQTEATVHLAGKLVVKDLSIDKLTVAGVELTPHLSGDVGHALEGAN